MKKLLFGLLLLFSSSSWAWDAMGHRVIAAIAYDHLTPRAKQQSVALVDYLANAYPYVSSWQMASVWADTLRHDDVNAFNAWHFYDRPYIPDQAITAPPPVPVPNSVWVFQQALTVLKSPHSKQFEKAFFFRFLLHLIGDIHQPLHNVTLINHRFLSSDHGGNLYALGTGAYPNLHKAWDDGLGFFESHCALAFPKSQKAICLAHLIEKDYPLSRLQAETQNVNPQLWADESYTIATNFAYHTPWQQPLAPTYLAQGQQIVEKQLALAGYRLATVLNQLYG